MKKLKKNMGSLLGLIVLALLTACANTKADVNPSAEENNGYETTPAEAEDSAESKEPKAAEAETPGDETPEPEEPFGWEVSTSKENIERRYEKIKAIDITVKEAHFKPDPALCDEETERAYKEAFLKVLRGEAPIKHRDSDGETYFKDTFWWRGEAGAGEKRRKNTTAEEFFDYLKGQYYYYTDFNQDGFPELIVHASDFGETVLLQYLPEEDQVYRALAWDREWYYAGPGQLYGEDSSKAFYVTFGYETYDENFSLEHTVSFSLDYQYFGKKGKPQYFYVGVDELEEKEVGREAYEEMSKEYWKMRNRYPVSVSFAEVFETEAAAAAQAPTQETVAAETATEETTTAEAPTKAITKETTKETTKATPTREVPVTKAPTVLKSPAVADHKYERFYKRFYESVPPIYDDIWDFSEGLAAVKRNGKYGYVNLEGQEIILPVYDIAWPFSNGLAKVKVGEKYGCVNQNGKEIIPPQYDALTFPTAGLIKVSSDEKKGLFDSDGKKILPPVYDAIGDFKSGLAAIKWQGKWGFINTQGMAVAFPRYDEVGSFADSACPLAAVRDGDKWGLINQDGKQVIPSTYDSIGDFTDGWKPAPVELNGKWGYLDREGKEVTPLQYTAAEEFYGDLALVEKDGLWGYLDTAGTEIIPPIYEENPLAPYSASEGFSEGLLPMVREGKYGYLDLTGAEAIPFIYEAAYPFSAGRAHVVQDGKSGFIDSTGQAGIGGAFLIWPAKKSSR